MKYFIFALLVSLLTSCNSGDKNQQPRLESTSYEAISLLGDTLYAGVASEAILLRYKEKKAIYDANPNELDNLIWYGRFTAYLGNYRKAIDIYSKGIEKFPEEPRLYRHRGHRFISIREFDHAISDLLKAEALIQGKENMTEPDGMPNARNIPVSTTHGNIFYHLGLAYYLQNDMPNALKAYKKCLETSANPDNVVSATHWIYMINRRMGRTDTANSYLANINENMDVIENDAYYKACLMYKGLLQPEEVYNPNTDDSASGSALKYAVGNWYYYNEQRSKAKAIFEEIVSGEDWASFGFIAAEADLSRMQ